jgi:hypothetical protein
VKKNISVPKTGQVVPIDWTWWYMPVIPSVEEAEIRGSQSEAVPGK